MQAFVKVFNKIYMNIVNNLDFKKKEVNIWACNEPYFDSSKSDKMN